MIYILFFIILLSSIVYLNVAKKFGIIDKPNERSSHKKATIRGGGILFSISALLFFLCYQFQYPFFIAGLLLVSIISFIDDIYTLKSSYRIVVQLIAIILTLYQVPYPDIQPFLLLMALFLITGMLNIFNFMDGINGITGLYGITTISSLLYVDRFITDFIDHHLLVLALFSLIVFGFYNFRVKAKMFAGDIGSISIGLIIIFGLSLLLVKTQNLMYLMFVLVYMLDGGCTIIQRAYSKENIFKPHRKHLYQLLVDKKNTSHLKVSFFYSFCQLMVNIVIIGLAETSSNVLPLVTIITFGLIAYLFFKIRISNKTAEKHT